MSIQNAEFDKWTNGLVTKSDKIRALARQGVGTADIARYLDIRYQHARNVLVRSGLHQVQTSEESSSQPREPGSRHAWIGVGALGEIKIPQYLLKAAGLELNDLAHVRLSDDGIEILSRSAALKRAQQIVSSHIPPGVSLVEELIAERRREANKESVSPA